MAHGLVKKTLMALAIFALAAALNSCGRKGALEAPSSSISAAPAEEGQKPEKPDRKFILDPLI